MQQPRREGDSLTAKEYLNQARTLDIEINTKLEELHQLKQKACCVQSVVISERVQSSNTNSSNKIIDKIVDLQNEINAEIDKLVDLKAEIRHKIENVYNPIYISVLTNIYVNCLTLEKTAEVMGKSCRTIKIWHKRALQIFKKENNIFSKLCT